MALSLSLEAFRFEPNWWRKLFRVGCCLRLGHSALHSLRRRSRIAVLVRWQIRIHFAAPATAWSTAGSSMTSVLSEPLSCGTLFPPMTWMLDSTALRPPAWAGSDARFLHYHRLVAAARFMASTQNPRSQNRAPDFEARFRHRIGTARK